MSELEICFVIVAVSIVSFLSGLFAESTWRVHMTGEINALGLFLLGLAIGAFFGVVAA